jgi:hypothetical protein
VTELRQRLLEELQRRNFSPSTIRGYIRTVRDFAAYSINRPTNWASKRSVSSNCICCGIRGWRVIARINFCRFKLHA